MSDESDCGAASPLVDGGILIETQFDEKSGKVAYDAAIEMIVLQNSVIWSSFMAILYANIAILAFIGALLSIFDKAPAARWICAILCVLGMILCGIWFAINSRNYAYHDYWFGWARLAEKSALGTDQAMIQIGRSLGSDNKKIKFPDSSQIHVMPLIKWPRISAVAKIKYLSGMAIFVILTMYFAAVSFIYLYPIRQSDERMDLRGVLELRIKSVPTKR